MRWLCGEQRQATRKTMRQAVRKDDIKKGNPITRKQCHKKRENILKIKL